MVMFAYLGIELIGVTAGEVKNPEKSLARAIDTVFGAFSFFTSELCLSLCQFIRGRKSVQAEARLF